MSMEWFDQNAGGSEPSVYFGTVGDKVVGVITGTPRPKEFVDEKGRTQQTLVVPMRATAGTTASKGKGGGEGKIADGEEVALFIRAGFLAEAVSTAIKAAGGKGLSEGDTLGVAFTSTKDTGQIQPAKLYRAQYVPGKAAVSVDDLIPAEEPPF